MARRVTLFTGQWADLPLSELAAKAADFGYNAAPPAEWTILLRARDGNGNAGGIARTTVTAAGTPVPAVSVAWLGCRPSC